jgi:hypothetical protein
VAGQIDGSGPTLLPEKFVRRLPREPSRDDTVRLGRLQAYRYAGLAPEGAAERVTVYASPTSEGVAAVACVAAPRVIAEFGPECERVATTLELSGAKPLPLGPREAYAKAVGAAFERLDEEAGAAAKRLRAADTPSAQSGAAGDLADAYRAAARSVSGAPAGPYEDAANSRLAASLRALTSAYARAAAAARDGDDRGYAAASRAVRRGAADLRRAQGGLRRLGYTAT